MSDQSDLEREYAKGFHFGVEYARRREPGAEAAELLQTVLNLKAIIELIVTDKAGTQFCNVETRSGKWVRVTDALISSEAVIARAIRTSEPALAASEQPEAMRRDEQKDGTQSR